MSAEFIGGATTVASLVIALFFLRYWQHTRDRLFLMFSAGFLVFAVSRLILTFLEEDDEGRVFIYTLRLLAFGLILAAIIDKNRSRAPKAVVAGHNGNVPRSPRPPQRPASRL